MATKLNLVVVGPSRTGKTAISNYIADLSETLEQNEYHPTQGLRILEFERALKADAKKNQKWREASIEVELWDCSGDTRFLKTWNSLSKQIHGALFVTSADGKLDKELDAWQEALPHLKSNQISVFAHKIVPVSQKSKSKPGNKILAKSPLVMTSLDTEPELIKSEFAALLSSVYTEYLNNKELEERAIIGRG